MLTCLYRHFDKNNVLLYVGVSLSAINRLGQHANNSSWYASIARVDIQRFTSRQEALDAEREAIKKEKPKHNVQHTRADPPPTSADNSRFDLVRNLVQFRPVYKLDDAAQVLNVNKTVLRRMVEVNDIGHIELPNIRKDRGLKKCITGWQIIEYLESHSHNGNR